MTREEKSNIIKELTDKLAETSSIYFTDISGLDAQNTNKLRRACFKANIKLLVVKNTLMAKAMSSTDKDFGDLHW
jgi:large subunit ribosomal protein L10